YDCSPSAYRSRIAERARTANRRNAGAARIAELPRPLSDPSDLGTSPQELASKLARANWLLGTRAGRTAGAVGELWSGCRSRQYRLARSRRCVAQERPRGRYGASHLDRYRSALDQIGLARLGVWLEVASDHDRRGGMDTTGCGLDGAECRG